MARKRMISPEIWQSEDFAKLSLLGKMVFIGMFSHADDEGRGRAKAAYIKSVLFPYERGMRVGDVDKALCDIARYMSVMFYRVNGNEYYQLVNWRVWQRVDKPQKSKLPPCDEHVERIRKGDEVISVKRARRTARGTAKDKEKLPGDDDAAEDNGMRNKENGAGGYGQDGIAQEREKRNTVAGIADADQDANSGKGGVSVGGQVAESDMCIGGGMNAKTHKKTAHSGNKDDTNSNVNANIAGDVDKSGSIPGDVGRDNAMGTDGLHACTGGKVKGGTSYALTAASSVTVSADDGGAVVTYETAACDGADGKGSSMDSGGIVEESANDRRTVVSNRIEEKTKKKNGRFLAPDQKDSTNDPVCISLPLCDGTDYPIRHSQQKRWATLYPAVDVLQELRKMVGWCEAAPNKRKTKSGILRFVTGWLAREQDRGGTRAAMQKDKPMNPALHYPQREIVSDDGDGIHWI